MANRLWHPTIGPTGPLLPSVNRGHTFIEWPNSPALAAEMNPQTYGRLHTINYDGKEYVLEDIDLIIVSEHRCIRQDECLKVMAVVPDHSNGAGKTITLWEGEMDYTGSWSSDVALIVHQGYTRESDFLELLRNYPPTIFYLNGYTSIGGLIYDSRNSSQAFSANDVMVTDWAGAGVDFTAETDLTAAKRSPPAISIHKHLEEWLVAQSKIGDLRWVLKNDGSGEIADYIVLELLPNKEIHMSLWHAKFAASNTASVRINDMEKVAAQGIKSRRWFKSRRTWQEISDRLAGNSSPPITIVSGSDSEDDLRRYLGISTADSDEDFIPWTRGMPSIKGKICIAQPGLSREKYQNCTIDDDAGRGITQLLTVLRDTAQADALEMSVLGSA